MLPRAKRLARTKRLANQWGSAGGVKLVKSNKFEFDDEAFYALYFRSENRDPKAYLDIPEIMSQLVELGYGTVRLEISQKIQPSAISKKKAPILFFRVISEFEMYLGNYFDLCSKERHHKVEVKRWPTVLINVRPDKTENVSSETKKGYPHPDIIVMVSKVPKRPRNRAHSGAGNNHDQLAA